MKKCCISAAVLLLSAQSTFASEFGPLEVVVTASRTAETMEDTLAAVTVITRDDIERLQAQSVQDVLQGTAGINITNNGGAGKTTSLFLRGTESDHMLVLIDGIKVGSATLGTTPFQHIAIEQVERIEIVRGPLSSLYGSEAIGGVIQIFTRKGGGELKPSFSIGVGSDETYKASAGISGGGDRGWFNLSASAVDTEGFNACDGKPSPGGAGCFTIEPDDDGYSNQSASLRAGYKFENELEIDVHAMETRGDTEYDGSYSNESESAQQVLGSTLRYSPADIWAMTFTAGRSQDESDSLKDGVFTSRFVTERKTLSLQNDFTITDNHLITLGFDRQDDEVDGTTAYAVTSRDNDGVFTQYKGTFDKHDLQLSLRQDDNEQFDEHNTGSAAWRYALTKDLKMMLSYGTAFKAPTFNELYYPGFGNASLLPEESDSVELGLDGKESWGRWSLNVYETNIDELIAYDSTTYAPGNIGQVRIQGLEVMLVTQIDDWGLKTNLTLTDPENRSSDANDGNVLARRAKQSMRIDVDRLFDEYSFGMTVLADGKRYDDFANTRELSGYGKVDLRADYKLSQAWLLQARIENMFDKEYETAGFFNQQGRSLFVTLRYQP